MNSQSSERKNSSTANDFPSIVPYTQFAAQNFIPLTPSPVPTIAPLAITLPLFYKPVNDGASGDAMNGDGGSVFNVKGDAGSWRSKPISAPDSANFTRTALRGCEIAEKIVHNHKNRPCFKKIDSLCARLKQDLSRQDSVLANINSQGIAWAVKDMIFTFTRIVNAWIIVKGYMYDIPPGLKKVKQSCSEGFDESFMKWQEATLDFLENLTESFEKLDNLVQTQKNRLGSNGRKEDKEIGRKRNSDISDESKDDDFFDDFTQVSLAKFSTDFCSDAKVESIRDGGYIRTGIYNNPLHTTNSNLQIDSEQLLQWEKNIFPQKNSPCVSAENPVKLATKHSPDNQPGSPEKYLAFLREKYGSEQGNPEDTLIWILLSKLYEMKDASLFFNKHFTKNYVPDYVTTAFTCKDMKSIMIAIEKRSYPSLSAIVKDLGAIIYDAKSYVKKHPDSGFLATNTKAFQTELKSILNDEIFSHYNFDYIFIDP